MEFAGKPRASTRNPPSYSLRTAWAAWWSKQSVSLPTCRHISVYTGILISIRYSTKLGQKTAATKRSPTELLGVSSSAFLIVMPTCAAGLAMLPPSWPRLPVAVTKGWFGRCGGALASGRKLAGISRLRWRTYPSVLFMRPNRRGAKL